MGKKRREWIIREENVREESEREEKRMKEITSVTSTVVAPFVPSTHVKVHCMYL